MRRTRSQIRAAQIAALVSEQEAYDRNVREAMKAAAFARCDAVEQLYELLEVKPEQPFTRTGKNGTYEVATDKNETKRSARLVDTVARLVSAVDADRQTSVITGYTQAPARLNTPAPTQQHMASASMQGRPASAALSG